jgi:hypothetical protein
MISFSRFPLKILAYEGAIFVPIAVPLICKKMLSIKCKAVMLQCQCEQTCPHGVVILIIAPTVFRSAKLSESNASAPMNKLQKHGLGNWHII